jgi:hypothetical protein
VVAHNTINASFSPINDRTKALLYFFLNCLVLVAFVDPADQIFHLKTPLFALIVLLWIARTIMFGASFKLKHLTLLVLTASIIPIFWTIVGILNANANVGEHALDTLKSFSFLLLLLIVLQERIDLKMICIQQSIWVAVLTCGLVLVNYFSPIVFATLYAFSLEKQNAMITVSRDPLGIGVGSFYYKTSAVLVLSYGYYLARYLFHKKTWHSFLLTLLFFSALLLSGARANIIATALISIVIMTLKIRRSIGLYPAYIAALVFILAIGGLYTKKFLNPQETSNTVKLGHFESYIALFEEHPLYFAFGQGVNTSFYSSGFEKMTTITELSYFELIRQFGLCIFAIQCFLLIAPIYLLAKRHFPDKDSYLIPSYIGYIFIAGTNPLLVSSTGLLIIVAYWETALQIYRDNLAPAKNLSYKADNRTLGKAKFDVGDK